MFYDKLPVLCYFCGLIGHTVEECGDGIHEPASCEWGDWLHWTNEPTNLGGGDRGGARWVRGAVVDLWVEEGEEG